MKTFNISEIINSHGQPIYNTVNESGNTDLDKTLNYYKNNQIKHTLYNNITDKNNDIIHCLVWYNKSEHKENRGYFVDIFNSIGEKIEMSFRGGIQLHQDDLMSLQEVLTDLDYL